MKGSPARRSLAGVLVVAVVLATAMTAGGTATFSLSVDDSIEVPARQITVEGDQYTVSELGRVQQGESINMSVSGPSDTDYDVYLYNEEIGIERTSAETGNSDVSFDTTALDPSTYLVAVYYDGNIQRLVPVVVAGYDVTADVPATVSEDGELAVSATVSATASSGDPPRVEFVIGDSDTEKRVTATESNGEYTATFDASQLDSGEYSAYIVVRGDTETKYGRDVILGASDPHTVEVTEATATPTPTATATFTPTQNNGGNTGGDTGSGGNTGETDGSSTPTATTAPTPTATVTPTPGTATATATPSATASPTPSPTATVSPTTTSTTTATVTPTASATATPTDSSVTTPNTSTTSPTPTPGQPGFGVVTALAALAAASLYRRR